MTVLQKVVKYLALALAIFLITTIISSIVVVILSISNFLGIRVKEDTKDIKELVCNYDNIRNLNISLGYSNLYIKESDKFFIQTNSADISCNSKNGTLNIKENKNWFFINKSKTLVIHIPSESNFNNITIDTGAGNVNIETLLTNFLNLDLGAGATKIDNISSNKAFISTGAGKLTISKGTINDLKFNMGVGEVSITSKLTGNNSIEAGVGSLKLNLLGNTNDYKVKIEKGIGKTVIDSKNVSDNEIIGTGINIVDIEGGVGQIDVNYIDE